MNPSRYLRAQGTEPGAEEGMTAHGQSWMPAMAQGYTDVSAGSHSAAT